MAEKAAWENVSVEGGGGERWRGTQEDIRHPSDLRNGANRIAKRQV